MKPSESEIKAFEDRIRAQYTGMKAPAPTHKPISVPEDQKPTSTRIRSSIDISAPQQVIQPKIKDKSGKVVTTGKISKFSETAYSNTEAQRIALERLKAEEDEAKKSLTNESLLNRLGAQERILKKLQKEIAELKKATNEKA